MVGGVPEIYNGSKSLDAHAKDFYIVISVFTPLTTLAIILRFYARKKKASGVASDDVFALICYVAYVVMIATFIAGNFPFTSRQQAQCGGSLFAVEGWALTECSLQEWSYRVCTNISATKELGPFI